MKGIRYLVAQMSVAVLISLFALSFSVTAQPPVPPHRFWGYVTFDGISAPAGLEVTARLDNGQIVSTVYTHGVDGDNNYYSMNIPCPTYEGQIVYFYVNGIYTGENREVVSGESTSLDLTVKDETGPIIENLRPADGSTVMTGRPTISASYSDALSGIDVLTATMKVNGSTVSSTVTATGISCIPATALPDGPHSVEVSVRDRVGNPSTESWSFTVSIAPEKATLIVDTNPIKGEVFVNGTSWGSAPQSRSVDPGTYTVSFGAVSGYVTPSDQTVTLAAGDTKTVLGTYEVPDFSISVSPSSGSVVQEESTTATVSVSSIAGFSETVSLSASGLPSGVTASFSPSSGTPSFESTLTISTTSTTPTGTYSITITGTGGGETHTCTYSLTATAVPSEQFPWPLTIGIIVAVVVIIAAVRVLYGRR